MTSPSKFPSVNVSSSSVNNFFSTVSNKISRLHMWKDEDDEMSSPSLARSPASKSMSRFSQDSEDATDKSERKRKESLGKRLRRGLEDIPLDVFVLGTVFHMSPSLAVAALHLCTFSSPFLLRCAVALAFGLLLTLLDPGLCLIAQIGGFVLTLFVCLGS